MRAFSLRVVLAGAVGAVCMVALGAPGCSSNSKKKVPYDGSAGEAGASGASSGRGGSTSEAGSSGTLGSAGESGAAGDAGAASLAAGAAGAPASDAGGADGAAASGGTAASGGNGGQLIEIPDIDAGVGCLPPADDTQLSALSAGLPTTGLALWLRADHGVYQTSDHRVCAWVDQSGQQRVFSAGSGRPLWVDASVGTRAALNFDASSGPLTIGGVLDLPPTSARTLIAVVKLTQVSARFQALMQGQDGSPGTYLNLDANTFGSAGQREGVYVQNNAYDSGLATSTEVRLHVYSIGTMTVGTPALSALNYRVNGATQTLSRTAGGLGNGNFEDFSGANFTLVGGGRTGLVAETLIYDHALNSAELAQVESALEARYGIVSAQQ
ncbi:MAG: hypothetical protein ABJB12_22145 [Pseudomonadota bacterium]